MELKTTYIKEIRWHFDLTKKSSIIARVVTIGPNLVVYMKQIIKKFKWLRDRETGVFVNVLVVQFRIWKLKFYHSLAHIKF